MPMNDLISRRDALKTLALGAGTILVAGATRARAADAGALPHVAANDPVAVSLGYHESAKTVEAAKFPNYKAGQMCSNCMQLTGKDGDAWRPCNLFPGKLVNAGGWCKVYVKKP
jgi:hypothetical protein